MFIICVTVSESMGGQGVSHAREQSIGMNEILSSQQRDLIRP